ncbi:MAG: c-type cytochrome [Methylococcaceae bacterium]|nr:c-type cytochrome [Methylococcaceae bacterium]
MIATIVSASRKAKALLILLAGLAANLEGGPAWAAQPGSPWGANYFPNVELTTQEGNKVRFYDDLIKGKVFAINFIYTRCTDSCPMETAALRKLQQALGDRMGRDVFFYTISIDAERDKPATLKEYAAKFKVGPGWTFLAGTKEDVSLIRQRLGMYRDDGKAEQKLSEHNINILMGSEAGGQWIKRSPFEETAALARILSNRLAPAGKVAAYAAASMALRPMALSDGEDVFRSKCEACHSLGHEHGIGPGLAGVMRNRDRTWLKRWIQEPDKLIRAKDPIATALYKQYKEIPMPNMRLSDNEVAAVMAYMENTAPPEIQAAR